jgi:hypothetical protein
MQGAEGELTQAEYERLIKATLAELERCLSNQDSPPITYDNTIVRPPPPWWTRALDSILAKLRGDPHG